MNQSDDDHPLVDLTNSSSPRTESATTNPSSVTLPSTKPHHAKQTPAITASTKASAGIPRSARTTSIPIEYDSNGYGSSR